jgi:RNA polymerase sigma-70 factor, ECF subfamily
MSTNPSDGRVTTDAVLVGRIALGDERALGALYDSQGAMAYALALAIAGSESAAEDVVAGVFARIWRGALAYDATRGSVAAWVAAMVRRDAIAARRAAANAGTPARAIAVASPGRAARTPRNAHVNGALAGLPEPQRRAIELAYFGGLTVGEIATTLHETEAAIREVLRSAMTSLRRALVLRPVTYEEQVATRL